MKSTIIGKYDFSPYFSRLPSVFKQVTRIFLQQISVCMPKYRWQFTYSTNYGLIHRGIFTNYMYLHESSLTWLSQTRRLFCNILAPVTVWQLLIQYKPFVFPSLVLLQGFSSLYFNDKNIWWTAYVYYFCSINHHGHPNTKKQKVV